MKKLMTMLMTCFIATGLLASKAQTYPSHGTQGENEIDFPEDSMVNVVGYFCKGDTCDYWIAGTQDKINGTDTANVLNTALKVRIVVNDSTAKGFKMSYTFTDIRKDTTNTTFANRFLNQVVDKIEKFIIGTTIWFETDEYGAITKINNMAQIKKQAKASLDVTLKEAASLPEVKAMQNAGFDITRLTQQYDVDQMVDGYLEELYLLFSYHGKAFKKGEYHDHEDATKDSYAIDTYCKIVEDEEGYTIHTKDKAIIPQSDMKEIVGAVLEDGIKDKSITDNLNKLFNEGLKSDGELTNTLTINYADDGWPMSVEKTNKMMIQGHGKETATYIVLDKFSERK